MRAGSFFLSLLEPRLRIDVALHAVVMQAWVEGVSTHKVDHLVAALGVDAGISKSEVSRICSQLDTEVAAWRSRPLSAQAFPYVFGGRDLLPQPGRWRRARQGWTRHEPRRRDRHRCVRRRPPGGARLSGRCSPAEFQRSLRERGLGGVRLVISDSHPGLRKKIPRIMSGAAWQRVRVHFMRNILAKAPKAQAEWVAAAVRTIFAQPAAAVRCQVETVATSRQPSLPDVARMLRDARADLTAFAGFPPAHWRKIWSNSPLERLNREVKRRTNVVGIFPDDSALLRLASCVLMEAHDKWQVSDRRYLSEEAMTELDAAQNNDTPDKEVVDNRAAIAA